MTAQLSRERLEEIKEFGCARIIKPISDEEILALVDMALAGMDSEPAAVIDKEGNPMTRAECNDDRVFAICCKVGTPLYAAAPAAVIPEGWEPCSPEWIERNGPCSCAEAPRIAFGTTGTHYHPHIWHKPAPVAVSDDAALRILFEKWFAADCAFDESPSATEEDNLAWKEGYWHVWKACRASMLKAGPVTAATVPDGWTANADANDALVMLDRIETVDCTDDERIESVKNIIRRLAAGPEQEV